LQLLTVRLMPLQVMARMSAAQIHRIYLCDAADRLIRVISFGDILAKLMAVVATLDVAP